MRHFLLQFGVTLIVVFVAACAPTHAPVRSTPVGSNDTAAASTSRWVTGKSGQHYRIIGSSASGSCCFRYRLWQPSSKSSTGSSWVRTNHGGLSMNPFLYFPILRWKQGEQIAMRRLDAADRALMLPTLEVQSLEATPAQPKLSKQAEFAGAKSSPLAIDLRQTGIAGPQLLPAVARVTSHLRAQGLMAWPLLHGVDILGNPAALSHFSGLFGVVLRINPSDLPMATAVQLVKDLRQACGTRTVLMVLVDFYAIADMPEVVLANFAEPYIRQIAATGEVFQVAVAGGSFPPSLSPFPQGVATRLPRKELTIWKTLKARPGCGSLAFGDYCVTNPLPLPDIDPRTMNPAAAIRYTLKKEWWLLRAAGVRTKGRGGMGQYNSLCKLLVASNDYLGAAFSFGDQQYGAYAQPGASSGSLMTWRRDATSHHLVYTVRQLASGNV